MATKVQRKKKDKSPSVEEMGKKLEALGKAMQQPAVKLGKIARLAADCGLSVGVQFSEPPNKEVKSAVTPQAVIRSSIRTADDQIQQRFLSMAQRETAAAGVPPQFQCLVGERVMQLLSDTERLRKDKFADDLEDVYLFILDEVRKFRDMLVKQIAEYDKAEKPAVASLKVNCDNKAKDDAGGR